MSAKRVPPGYRRNSRPRLIVYATAPEAGRVKIDIAATLGKRRAAEVYRAILAGFFARLRSLLRSWHVEIHFRPADKESLLLPEIAQDFPRVPQLDGNLGARLSHSFATAFGTDPRPVVIVGTDCPDLPIHFLHTAQHQLATHDAVVGPCADGSLYLLGLRAPVAGLFEGISGSSRLGDAAVKQLEVLGKSCYRTPEWRDVDTMADIEAFLARSPEDRRVAKMQNRIRATLSTPVKVRSSTPTGQRSAESGEPER